MVETVELLKNQITIARTEIKNLRQQLSSIRHEHQKEINFIKSTLSNVRCYNCPNLATISANNSAAQVREDPNLVKYRPIGIIETSFQNKRAVPRQATILAKAQGIVIIDTAVYSNPEHALDGLREFSHMWIIFHFHNTEGAGVAAKVAPPRLHGERRGVLSTRSPHRPCPIGLSLVQIVSIEGNKIHFRGVDMINGTPVLDIKPYIPQYDYPAQSFGDGSMSSLIRPPTEGISDVTEAVSTLPIDDDAFDNRLSPRLTHPIGIEVENPTQNPRPPYPEATPSPTTPQDLLMTPVSPSPESPSGVDNTFARNLLDANTFTRSPLRRPQTERGAPDGQERFTPPQTGYPMNVLDGIRVAPWITDPPTQPFEVRFSNESLARLRELIGDRADAFKTSIESLLSEDPRSHYVRNRYPDHEYSCVLEDLSIGCIFDDSSALCTIVTVRNAEELQQT